METETTWIDAWIRWDRNSKDIIDDEEEEDDDEERVPPTTEFSFDYKLENDADLTLVLKGFPSESEQIWNSTGLTLWPSSHYLCEYLLDHSQELLPSSTISSDFTNSAEQQVETTPTTTKEEIKAVSAIELGSGLGRCGLLLHHLLTRQRNITSHVYMTDGDTDTLAQLRDNVVDNTNSSGTTDSKAHNVSCHQLLWGKDSTMAFCEHHFSNTSKTLENRPNSVHLVFGSDLVYSPRVIGPLFETVSVLLTTNTIDATTRMPTKFLMAHSDRREGSSVTLKMVLEGAKAAGLEYEILQTIQREGIYIIAFEIRQ